MRRFATILLLSFAVSGCSTLQSLCGTASSPPAAPLTVQCPVKPRACVQADPAGAEFTLDAECMSEWLIWIDQLKRAGNCP